MSQAAISSTSSALSSGKTDVISGMFAESVGKHVHTMLRGGMVFLA